jgi:hypothetical protein
MASRKHETHRYILLVLVAAFACLSLASSPGRTQTVPLHDRMLPGEHTEFKWYSNLAGWLYYRDGMVTGLPDIGFRSAIVSGIRFDETAGTIMMIARIDRNDFSKFYIGYTDVPPDFSSYSENNVDYGVFIDSTGAVSPSWNAGNEAYWSSSLPLGIYDLRITIDRVSSAMTVDLDQVPAYDSPLSVFDPPILSITENVDLADILYIQMNLYNPSSAVFDVWSVKPTPALLMIHHPQDAVVAEGDTVAFTASAEYDGEKELVWHLDDPRFTRDGDTYRWITRDGDGGLYSAALSVTDGHLIDSMTFHYAVTQAYDPMLNHDRMNGLPGSPNDWIDINEAFWYTIRDGYLRGTDGISWISAAITTREEPLDEIRSWVFRVEVGSCKTYAIGLTETPPDRHDGRSGNLALGLLIEGRKVSRAWYSSTTQFEGTVLAEGIYDIRITWDPAIAEARFEAVPVAGWPDSLSIFSEAVWTTWADGLLDAPAWIQASVIAEAPRIYDLWSYTPHDGPGIVEQYRTAADPTGIELSWTVADHDVAGEFVILRCPDVLEGCRELARVPLIDGMTGYGYDDEDVLPGSTHSYRVYLDRGLGMEMLFETGMLEVPVAPAQLFQNNPNPFNPGTRIRWYLPSASRVRIVIFDVTGRPVRLLVDEKFEAGINSTDWDGTRDSGDTAASGVYFYRIEAGSFTDSKKMILIR